MIVNDTKHDVLVVGAGIFGCAIAVALARDGFQVTLFERDMKEPDRIVGELLQPGGVQALYDLGLDDCIEDIDATVNYGYAVFNGNDVVQLQYPNVQQIAKSGRSFHYGKFVMRLRRAVMREPNITLLEVTVQNLIFDKRNQCTGLSYKSPDSDEIISISAPLTIVADGCFSKFRKTVHTCTPVGKSNFVGFELYQCKLPFEGHGHVILGKHSIILLYRNSSTSVRALVDISGTLPSTTSGALQNYLQNYVLPDIPTALHDVFQSAILNEKYRSMPNNYLSSHRNQREGLFLAGDALNMRHPLTGGGMTVALKDALLLRSLMRDYDVRNSYFKIARKFHGGRKQYSSVINTLAQALYEIFRREKPEITKECVNGISSLRVGLQKHSAFEPMDVLRRGCFQYFQRGGTAVSVPMGLLGGLFPFPSSLLYHFYAVAWEGLRSLWRDYRFPLNLYYSVRTLFVATKVIGPYIFSEVFG